MSKAHRQLVTLALISLDILTLGTALTLAYRLGSVRGMMPVHFDFLSLAVVAIPTAIALFALNRLYVLDELLEGSTEYGRITYACTLTTLSLIVFGFWAKNLGELAPSRPLMALLWILFVVIAGTGRFLARRVVRALRRRGHLISRALIVGLGRPGISLARHFRENAHAGIEVVGFVDDFLPPGTQVTEGLSILGPPSALTRIVHETAATEIIVVPTAMAWESYQDLIRTATNLNGHAIRLSPGFRDVMATNVKVHQFGFVPLLTIERVRITGLDAVLKRITDYGAAIILLQLALPIVAVLSVALFSTGIRPLRRVRTIGREGETFNAFLLNTVGPRNMVQEVIAHWKLDKLPQLVNVLLGQMSIVGPRPIPVDQKGDYEQWLPNLATVKPGVTGPWAMRSAWHSIEDEMQSALFYIRNYTIWLDLEILARSVARRLAGPGPGGGEETVAREGATVYH